MKIAYVMETLAIKGGVERIMVDKMNYLADVLRYDITLVEVYDYKAQDAYFLSTNIKRVRLSIRKTRIVPLKTFTFIKVVRRVTKAINQISPDIMTCAGLLGIILYGLKRYGCKMIYESHGPRHNMPLQPLVKRMERHVDCVVSLTRGDAAEYTVAKRVETIPNFISISPKNCKSPAYNGIHIVALGRMTPEKGFDLLIRSWQTVHARHPECILDIYGDGTERKHLEQAAGQLNLQQSVHLYPPADDVDNIYNGAYAVAVPSVFEGFSLVTLEAMSHGVPVVASDVPYGLQELLGNGNGGLLVKRVPEDFAKAIIALIENSTLREEIGRKGIKEAKRYVKTEIMSKWETLLHSLLG